MATIPSAVGVYEDEDGDLWIRFGAGKDKWLHLAKWHPTPIDRSWMFEFVTDEDVAGHLPLECISTEKKEEER